MRALVLSDIHANLEALNAVLAAAGDWDVLWNLGDMVGYGASPNQVLDIIRPLSTLTVRGNHDRVCSGLTSSLTFNPTARTAALWTHDELTSANLVWLRSLPQGPLQPEGPDSEIQTPGVAGVVTLAHGSPLNEDQYIATMRDAWAPLQQMPTDLTFFGHTHVQGGFSQKDHNWHELRPRYHSHNDVDRWTLPIPPGTRHLINPGSVGQPRDYDWRAAFAIYDSEALEVTYFRVPYDLRRAQTRILIARLPERLAARLREGR
jgi:predicted phosphodiesterase